MSFLNRTSRARHLLNHGIALAALDLAGNAVAKARDALPRTAFEQGSWPAGERTMLPLGVCLNG